MWLELGEKAECGHGHAGVVGAEEGQARHCWKDDQEADDTVLFRRIAFIHYSIIHASIYSDNLAPRTKVEDTVMLTSKTRALWSSCSHEG